MFHVEKLYQDQTFLKIARPVNSSPPRDAEFYLGANGMVVNVEGWAHPAGKILGEVLYTPDPDGNKTVFGLPYTKISLIPGTYTPVPYDQRESVLARYHPDLVARKKDNPPYAKNTILFDRSEFVAKLPQVPTFQTLLREAVPGDDFLDDLENLQKLLGIDINRMQMGLTGAPLLGNIIGYHDLDLVFISTIEENLRIAKRMRELVLNEPHRRLNEGGKHWNIRFFNDRQKLMCNFFGYLNPADAPLVEFTMDVIEPNIQIEGTVSADEHSMYTPTYLGLTDVTLTQVGEKVAKDHMRDIPLVVYHTATRGECFKDDQVHAQGSLVNVTTKIGSYEAVLCTGREDVRNKTPTFKHYYDD